jgi:DNA-binding winged helix-turn-helix (wHTH) protein
LQENQKEKESMEESRYNFGEFSMAPGERQVFWGTHTISLPPKTFDVLQLLVRNHGDLVSRSEIAAGIWPGVHVTDANLTNIIVSLRKILGHDSIQTVSKFGYRFTLPVTGEPGIKQAAYVSFVRGKELLQHRSLDSIQRARDLFWFCLAQDPQFAPAWAWFGRACRLLAKFSNGAIETPDLAEAAFQRAFAIDPDLACAHYFYTQLQMDSGRALQAMTRLASRLKTRGEDPETLAALVQVFRYCGLLDESVVAHERAVSLDPTIRTSIAHTYFLQGRYADVFENYIGTHFYLDVAAWSAMGEVDRAIALLSTRLAQPELSPLMRTLEASLLAVLESKPDQALELMHRTPLIQEPEVLFYLARHCGMLNAAEPTIHMLRRARLAGFFSSQSLQNDPAFRQLRDHPDFQCERQEMKRLEEQARAASHTVLDHFAAPR